MTEGRNLWFRVGREYFPELSQAQAHRRKYGGNIEQVLSHVLPPVDRPEKRVRKRQSSTTASKPRKRRSKYDPTAPLPEVLSEFL